MAWFVGNGIEFELECRHPADPAVPCDRELLISLGADGLMETHVGGKAPLRDGLIRSWWTGEPGAAQLWWDYKESPELGPSVLPSVPEAPSAAPLRHTGLFGGIAAGPRPRHLHGVRLFLDDGWFTPELTCLHPKEADEAFCDKNILQSDGMLQYSHRGRTGLRDGTIESWWETYADDSDLVWVYVDPTGTCTAAEMPTVGQP